MRYLLIRDLAILVCIEGDDLANADPSEALFYDVRTGVQIREIHPPLQCVELERGIQLPPDSAHQIMKSGASRWDTPPTELGNVVSIVEMRQRKLDSIVADSILDQLQTITTVLGSVLKIAETADKEERLWLSQQVLTLIRKFSGRELAELEEIVEWFQTRPKR